MALEGDLDVSVSDDEVRFAYTVENTGDESVELQFSDACKVDYFVLEEGQEVWRYTDGRAFAQIIGDEELRAGESRTYEGTWDDPQEGEFTAVAELCAQTATAEARTDFTYPR